MTDPNSPEAVPPTDWDARTVDRPGGHVYQSVAWAEHRRTTGWRPWFIVRAEVAVLALSRAWPLIGGGSAYIPHGPAPPGDGAAAWAALQEACRVLEERGLDVVASDAEVPAADAEYRRRLASEGFHPIEEIQPSRHRISVPLDVAAGEEAAFARIARSTRQRIHQAERAGVVVTRHDSAIAHAGQGDGFAAPTEPSEAALDRFYDLLRETGDRRHFTFGPRGAFVNWWRAAHAAGHLVLLEAWADERPIAGLVLYRHGERLTTVHSGDRAAARGEHPGAAHLLRWRALQLALRERRSELDLGGVDVAGARREPRQGEPTWGLYQHKLSFGGRWVELAGAHERVVRPWRYAAGRAAAKLVSR